MMQMWELNQLWLRMMATQNPAILEDAASIVVYCDGGQAFTESAFKEFDIL